MEFRYHVLLGLILSILFGYFFESIGLIGGTIIFLSSILIDADHYFWYVHRFKDPNPLKGIKWYLRQMKRERLHSKEKLKNLEQGYYFLHDFLAWTIVLILGIFLHKYFLFVLLGFAIHIIPDLIAYKLKGVPIMAKVSAIYVLKTNKNKEKLESL